MTVTRWEPVIWVHSTQIQPRLEDPGRPLEEEISILTLEDSARQKGIVWLEVQAEGGTLINLKRGQ